MSTGHVDNAGRNLGSKPYRFSDEFKCKRLKEGNRCALSQIDREVPLMMVVSVSFKSLVSYEGGRDIVS